ncbi:hypothetical protein ACIQ57_24570 [Lysinibacillus xylanilyticus]|uniref:hypothetical protein n=1 Tax=Lysinibacillus xylanilyticus TaxID=582475 RepID=UPI00381A6115
MAKDKIIKLRASEYDKAVLKALAETVTQHNKVYDPTESDMVRMAISEMAKKYLGADKLNELRIQYLYNNK